MSTTTTTTEYRYRFNRVTYNYHYNLYHIGEKKREGCIKYLVCFISYANPAPSQNKVKKKAMPCHSSLRETRNSPPRKKKTKDASACV